MIFENWKNVVGLWQAIEKYWKIRNIVIWHLPNRRQGFSARHHFFSKYDIAQLADKGKAIFNEEPEIELNNYLIEKGQKLLDSYEVIIYGNKGDSSWEKTKGTKWGNVADHISWTASSEASTGQNLVFGTKPIQILVPYIKILSPRNGIVMEPYAGSNSTMIACEIMHRRCRAIEISPTYGEVCINRWQKFTGKEPERIEKGDLGKV
jgi:DNA modification methylase